MTRSGLEGFGRTLAKDDEVVVEATGNAMAVVRVLTPYVARVIMANPLQVRAIAHARIKTDKIDAGVLASLRAADFLPEVWLPDPATERLHEEFKRRIKTHTVLPSAETAAMLFWVLLASGQITMRKVDGRQSLGQPPSNSTIDLAH